MARIPPKQPKQLSNKLREIRERLNLSQIELAEKLSLVVEVSQSQVSAFERGARIPSLLTILAYAKVYGVSTDILIDDKTKLPKL